MGLSSTFANGMLILPIGVSITVFAILELKLCFMRLHAERILLVRTTIFDTLTDFSAQISLVTRSNGFKALHISGNVCHAWVDFSRDCIIHRELVQEALGH